MTKFEQLIEKDIENGTFHTKNIYCKEYLQSMFFEYGINLEKENEQLKQKIEITRITLEMFENTEDTFEKVFLLRKLKELLGDTNDKK